MIKKLFTFMFLMGCLCAHAQLGLQASVDDLEKLEGRSEQQVRDAATTIGQFPTDDKNKIFFLYNVKTGLLLNAGGYWGTHVSLQETGLPLWVHLDNKDWIHFGQEFDKDSSSGEEGNYLEYESTKSNSLDNGVYVDRAFFTTTTNYWGTTYTTYIKRGWKLEAVNGKTNIYKIYSYARNPNYNNYNTSSNADANFYTDKKYYLIAFSTQGDVDKNCGAVEESSSEITTSNGVGNDEWKFISFQQIYDLQSKKSENITNSLDLTFKLQCPGFSRENAALSYWKTYKYGGDGNIRFGLEHYYKMATAVGTAYETDFKTGFSYTFPDGDGALTFGANDRDNYERHCGKYYCADVKNARGAIYQDVHVDHGGAYVIECKAFSTTTKAKLFAVLLDESGNVKTNTLHATVVGQTRYMSDSEKTALHIDEQNMDYAGKEFYGNHKYTNSVLVQVPDGGGDIRFGIEIGSTTDTTPVSTAKEWTVFDDFRLLYASKTTDGDLVLDEDRDNLSYLSECSNTYTNVILHLNKTFTQDKWNSFVLPVNLTKDQMTQAFGPNVKLAELTTLNKKEIQFTSVDLAAKGNDAVVLEAYKPYIIFPTKFLDLEQGPAYKAMLSKTGNQEVKDVTVAVKKNHIDIPNVSLQIKLNTEGSHVNDLDYMNTDTWTSNITGGDGTMTAYGTFARTFGTGTQELNEDADNYGEWTIANKSNIINGRDNLVGCYFFDKGDMYYSATRPRGLRGFSLWFSPASSTQASEAKVMLDGISLDETTGISPIIYGEESQRGKYAPGVYNLQGQLIRLDSTSMQDLPSGIYIVNGKKVFWK